MSVLENGKHVCDNCGTDVGGGGVLDATVVSDLDPRTDNTTVRNLHFCRDREEDGTVVRGCNRKILRPSAMKHYEETLNG